MEAMSSKESVSSREAVGLPSNFGMVKTILKAAWMTCLSSRSRAVFLWLGGAKYRSLRRKADAAFERERSRGKQS